jgi:thiamine biosynthesis lipoprotein
VLAHDITQAQHLLLADEGFEVTVAVHVGHEQMERVRPEVEGRDAHGREGKPHYGDGVHTAQFRAMGTDVTVLTLDGPPDVGERAANSIERLEAMWSRFRPSSELCALNDAAGQPVVVSPETFAVVALAVDACASTGGRYDPTVLPAVVAAGYDRDFDAVRREGPGAAAQPAGPAPGCAGIALDAVVHAVTLPAVVNLDLGGIGKGYAADLVSQELIDFGARGALVNLGGDLRARGSAPEPHGWVVAIDDPMETGVTGVLVLRAGAIATSTRLRRVWQRDGRALHHLIDPRTGQPVDSGLASVTVVAPEAWQAEILAKAAFIAGSAAPEVIAAAPGATGLLVHDDGVVEELPGLASFRA